MKEKNMKDERGKISVYIKVMYTYTLWNTFGSLHIS